MLFTSKSVTERHPDKFCDQISDAVLGEGEATTAALFDLAKLAPGGGHEIGYTSPVYGYDVNSAAIVWTIHAQSPDIDLGVTKEGRQIATGGPDLMLRYAYTQTKELTPPWKRSWRSESVRRPRRSSVQSRLPHPGWGDGEEAVRDEALSQGREGERCRSTS